MTADQRLTIRMGLVLLVAALAVAGAEAASRYDPALRFRTLTTPHFAIYYHQGEERLARRLAVVAEQVHPDLTARLATQPRGRTHVVLVDQDDRANGLSTVFPYGFIELVAGPPPGSSLIGNTDDWLRLVFVHEYAHVLTLDRSESFAAGLRRVFGRAPFAFPNLFQPAWQIEGVATYAETALTGRGRLAAGDFAAILAEPKRAGRFEPVDRAGGELVPWPGGITPYAFGGFFYRHLANQYGEGRLAQLAATTARGYYFLPGPAFSKVFGKSLRAAWRDFEEAFPVSAGGDAAGLPGMRRLTHHGFQVESPRFLSQDIVYALQDAHDFPSLMVVAASGTAPPTRLANRYGGTRIAGHDRSLVFDQLEVSRSVALRSDLYTLDLGTRQVQRLTRDGRLVEPDISPDGKYVACVRLAGGVRTLVVLDMAALSAGGNRRLPEAVLAVEQPDTQFGSPRWSPDGRRLAAERWPLGGDPEIVVIDAASGAVTSVTRTPAGRDVSPAWWPDGRTLVFASDREGGDFGLYAVDVGAPGDPPPQAGRGPAVFRVARIAGGAGSPDVSPDGRTIVFVGYTPAGYDLYTIPAERDRWIALPAADAGGAADTSLARAAAPAAGVSSLTVAPASAASESGSSTYSPLGTLVPRYWIPVLRTEDGYLKAGVSTGGVDVLGRHAFDASLVWHVSGGRVDEPHRARPDWSLSYVYDRWRAALTFSASDKGWFTRGPPVEGSGTLSGTVERDLDVTAGVRVPFVRVRRTQAWVAALAFERRTSTMPSSRSVHDRSALRLGWAFSTARQYGYSISSEQGVAIGVATEHVRRVLGADGNADALTAEIRAYPRVGARHAILSLRAGAGTSAGDAAVRRLFYLGGSNASGPLVDFGSEALSMLRGFDDTVFAGRHTVVANVDYRRPLFRVDRGPGWWPVMVRVVHGAVFVDAGNVWNQRFSINDTKVSAGGEVSMDLVAGYALPLTVTLGGAWTRDGAGRPSSGRAVYVRLGRAF